MHGHDLHPQFLVGIVIFLISLSNLAWAEKPSVLFLVDDSEYEKYSQFIEMFDGPFHTDRNSLKATITNDLLKDYSIVVILEPNRGYNQDEINTLKQFVSSGNYLVFILGYNILTYEDDIRPAFQNLLNDFGIDVKYSSLRDNGAECYQAKGQQYIIPHPITMGVDSFSYCRVGYISSLGSLRPLIQHDGTLLGAGSYNGGGLVISTMSWTFTGGGFKDTSNFSGTEEEIRNKRIVDNLVPWLSSKIKPIPLEDSFITIKLEDFAEKTTDINVAYNYLSKGEHVFNEVPFYISKYTSFDFSSGNLVIPVKKTVSQVIVLMNGIYLTEESANAPGATTKGDITGRIVLLFENGLRLSLDVVVGHNLRNYETFLDITDTKWVVKTTAGYVKNVYTEEIPRIEYRPKPSGDLAEIMLPPDHLYLDSLTINIPDNLRNVVLDEIIFEGNPYGYTNAFIAGLTVSRSDTPFHGYNFQIFGEGVTNRADDEKAKDESYLISFQPVSVGGKSVVSISFFDIFGVSIISVAVITIILLKKRRGKLQKSVKKY